MIFGIAGASGTGKTTLGHHVGEALDIPFLRTSVTEMARNAGFNAVGKLNLEDRLVLQEHMLKQMEAKLLLVQGPIILDRTPIDMLGYMLAEIDMHSSDRLTVEQMRRIDAYATQCQELTYRFFAHVFVTGILPDYELAETRPGFNPAYQRHLHTLVLGGLNGAENTIDYTLLVTDSLHHRVDAMTTTIADVLNRTEAERRERRLH
jgi:predicted ATPase